MTSPLHQDIKQVIFGQFWKVIIALCSSIDPKKHGSNNISTNFQYHSIDMMKEFSRHYWDLFFQQMLIFKIKQNQK